MNITELESKTRDELVEQAKDAGVSGAARLKKQDLVLRLLQAQSATQGNLLSGGVIDIVDDGYGFLRGESLLPAGTDVYVSQSQVRRFALRPGDYVTGQVRPPRDGEKYYGLYEVDLVNGMDPEEAKQRPYFENQTAIFPNEQFALETEDPANLSGRLIDLVAPLGRGQRGLIVSPPKAGKTMLLQSIANGVISNSETAHLIVVLVGERPEEVTEMRRTVRGEVVSSTFDDPVEDHTRVAEMALERAKRLMECSRDVVILCDSITRLTRAYNLEMPSSGRTLTGGMDPVALYPPKRFFGAARKAEEGGSLTIIATCLIDTGSRLDDVIYEEFKGTGNWEVHLDRKLSERRVFPAIDIARSGTRREELLLPSDKLQRVWLLRRMMSMLSSGNSQTEPTERLLERLSRTKSNDEFLSSLATADA